MIHMRTSLHNRAAGDSGAVAILVALLLIVLIGFGALAVDMGYAYAVKRQQSVSVDAAALAGAQAVGIEYRDLYPTGGDGCTPTTKSQVDAAAQAAATDNYAKNDPQGDWDDPIVDVACEGEDFTVTVAGSSTLQTLLGGVLGQTELRPGAQATAIVSGTPAYSGLRPYAICIDDIDAALSYLDTTQQTTTQQTEFAFGGNGNNSNSEAVTCGDNPPGNWGLVDFDGGANGTPSLGDWTENGYGGPVTIPDLAMPGDPGANFNANKVRDALDSIVGDTVLLPIASVWNDGGGNNASFNATGVLSAEICGFWISPNKTPSSGQGRCWDQGLLDSTDTQNLDMVLQWRYVSHSTSFQGNGSATDGCSLTDPECVPAIRLWR